MAQYFTDAGFDVAIQSISEFHTPHNANPEP
jgi:hypothetical protein